MNLRSFKPSSATQNRTDFDKCAPLRFDAGELENSKSCVALPCWKPIFSAQQRPLWSDELLRERLYVILFLLVSHMKSSYSKTLKPVLCETNITLVRALPMFWGHGFHYQGVDGVSAMY